jgi:hypothetical protein
MDNDSFDKEKCTCGILTLQPQIMHAANPNLFRVFCNYRPYVLSPLWANYIVLTPL